MKKKEPSPPIPIRKPLERPIAYVVSFYTSTGRHWKVIQCPYCGSKEHGHGAGPVGTDPNTWLGPRFAPCGGGNYLLNRQKQTPITDTFMGIAQLIHMS